MASPKEPERQLRTLQQFSLDVAHDLHGSLASIGMLALMAQQHLTRGELGAATQDLSEVAEQARLSQITLEALWRLASPGDHAIQTQTYALAEVARAATDEAMRSIRTRFPDRRLPKVQLHLEGIAQIDRGLVHVMLVNLINNALKFNLDHDEVEVRVSRDAGPTESDLVLVVRDDGAGFDPATLAAPQDTVQQATGREGQADPPWTQTDPIPSRRLGLSIVRRAAERLGGQLDVCTARGQGTTVRVTLPNLG